MALDFKQSTANALLDEFDTLFPNTAVLELRTGASPGAENAATGTLIASMTLGASPWLAAAAGVKDIDADLVDASANATGTIAHFRLKNAGDTHRIDGTVTNTGGGGDIELDNVAVNAGQQVTITSVAFTLT